MRTTDSCKAANFDIIGVNKLITDEYWPKYWPDCNFRGFKLELRDKEEDIISRIRLTDEQGVPLIYKIW